MTEKNIIVNRGIPPGTSSGSASSFGGHQETGLSGTSSSTHIGTIYIGTPGHSPFFGAGWHNINSTTGLEHGAGGGAWFDVCNHRWRNTQPRAYGCKVASLFDARCS